MAGKREKIVYDEICRTEINESRNAVVSKCSVGGFTLAQQGVLKENGKETPIFMQGAFHIENLDKLYKLRDALNVAIDKIESEIKS